MKLQISSLYVSGLAITCLAGVADAGTPAPRWQIPTICQSAKSNEECSRLESLSRDSVLNRWSKTPEADRTACLGQIGTSGKPSYWRLLDCLGDRAVQDTEH